MTHQEEIQEWDGLYYREDELWVVCPVCGYNYDSSEDFNCPNCGY